MVDGPSLIVMFSYQKNSFVYYDTLMSKLVFMAVPSYISPKKCAVKKMNMTLIPDESTQLLNMITDQTSGYFTYYIFEYTS